jgi:regulator of protease activity HflC (stomatin/prohibitin superfamily)
VIAVIVLVVILVLALMATRLSVRVVNQTQRGVILRFGRFARIAQPGLVIIVPIMNKMMLVDVVNQVVGLSPQQGITADNVSVSIDAVVTFQVADPEVAVLGVSEYARATLLTAETALRATIGAHSLDKLLSDRATINQELTKVIGSQVAKFGVSVATVEVRDVRLDEQMIRSMAAVAEADRQGRAKIIAARADRDAAAMLREAADIMDDRSMMLLQLNTLREITKGKSTIVIPANMPMLGDAVGGAAAALAARDESSAG